eukprot:767009-Hanusia_phi.AAC.4
MLGRSCLIWRSARPTTRRSQGKMLGRMISYPCSFGYSGTTAGDGTKKLRKRQITSDMHHPCDKLCSGRKTTNGMEATSSSMLVRRRGEWRRGEGCLMGEAMG